MVPTTCRLGVKVISAGENDFIYRLKRLNLPKEWVINQARGGVGGDNLRAVGLPNGDCHFI